MEHPALILQKDMLLKKQNTRIENALRGAGADSATLMSEAPSRRFVGKIKAGVAHFAW